MTRVLATFVGCLLLMPAESAAHRLDEYLQATRVSLARDGVALEVDLTPGANVASSIVALLDSDADGAISAIEAGAYGHAVLADLVLELDGRPVSLTLDRVEAPAIGEMRDGIGTIMVRAAGRVEPVGGGQHQLGFRNNHRPEGSVYLFNALTPDDRSVTVAGQTRDARQREARIDFTVGARWSLQSLWLLLGGAVLAVRATMNRATMRRLEPRR